MGEKLAVVGLEAHEREKLQVKMLESQIKFNESCKKQDEKAEKDRQKVADKTAKRAIFCTAETVTNRIRRSHN